MSELMLILLMLVLVLRRFQLVMLDLDQFGKKAIRG